MQRSRMLASDAAERATRSSRTIGYFAAFVGLGFIAASLGPTLPGLAQHTRSTLAEISFLFMARSFGNLLGSLWVGRLYDRRPGHVVLAAILLTIAGLLFAIPFLSHLTPLIAVVFALGVGQRMLDVGAITMIAWTWSHRVGPYMNALHVFLGVGALLSPVLVAQVLAASGDVTWAYWALAAIMIPIAAWHAWTRSPRLKDHAGERAQIRLQPVLIILFSLFLFLHVGAQQSFSGWIYTYSIALDVCSKTTAAYLTSAFWASLTAGLIVAVLLTSRFPPRRILVADLIGCLASIGVVWAWPDSAAALWAGTVGMGVSTASIFPTTVALIGRRFAITGRMIAWMFVGGSLGGMTVPWIVGQLFDRSGPQIVVVVIFVDLVLAFVALQVLLAYVARAREGPAAESHTAKMR